MHTDSTSVRGKTLASISLQQAGGNTYALLANLTPTGLGGRTAIMGQLFQQFRIKEMIFKVIAGTQSGSGAGGTANAVIVGIQDDATNTEGDGPVSPNAVLNYRTSLLLSTNGNPVVRTWKPADSKKWFYTYPGSTGSDPRFVVPGILWVGLLPSTTAGASVYIDVEIDYSISFKSAVTQSSTSQVTIAEPEYISVPTAGTVLPVRQYPPLSAVSRLQR